MAFWRRPQRAMTDVFTPAGFRINVISEPFPAPGAHEQFLDLFMGKPSGAFLRFQKIVADVLNVGVQVDGRTAEMHALARRCRRA